MFIYKRYEATSPKTYSFDWENTLRLNGLPNSEEFLSHQATSILFENTEILYGIMVLLVFYVSNKSQLSFFFRIATHKFPSYYDHPGEGLSTWALSVILIAHTVTNHQNYKTVQVIWTDLIKVSDHLPVECELQ